MTLFGENPIVLVQDGMLYLHGSDWSSIREARNIVFCKNELIRLALERTIVITHRYSTSSFRSEVKDFTLIPVFKCTLYIKKKELSKKTPVHRRNLIVKRRIMGTKELVNTLT